VMLATLQVYGYCCGVLSSRAIEALCRLDASFRLPCAAQVPDHATITRFRRRLCQEGWRRSCYEEVSTLSGEPRTARGPGLPWDRLGIAVDLVVQ
jgi:hypothetical protein